MWQSWSETENIVWIILKVGSDRSYWHYCSTTWWSLSECSRYDYYELMDNDWADDTWMMELMMVYEWMNKYGVWVRGHIHVSSSVENVFVLLSGGKYLQLEISRGLERVRLFQEMVPGCKRVIRNRLIKAGWSRCSQLSVKKQGSADVWHVTVQTEAGGSWSVCVLYTFKHVSDLCSDSFLLPWTTIGEVDKKTLQNLEWLWLPHCLHQAASQ